MSKKWYPVINYDLCIACGACVAKCKKGVYEKNTTRPNVIYPEGCVDGCRGCQLLCPIEAIAYVGDTGNLTTCTCECSCG